MGRCRNIFALLGWRCLPTEAAADGSSAFYFFGAARAPAESTRALSRSLDEPQRVVRAWLEKRGAPLSTELGIDGDAHQVHRAARAQLLLELSAVVGDGLVGDAQDVGDFGHGLALGEKAQDFQFAWRKVGNAARVGPGAQERDLAGHFWMKVAPAFSDPAHRLGEQQGIVVFGDIALGAGLDRPRGEHWIVVHAEDDDARVGLSLENAAAEFEAGQARQIQVDQGDVWLVR